MESLNPLRDGHTGDGRKDCESVLVLCLANGLGIAVAAERATVSQTTVYRRLRDPRFRQWIAETRTRLFDEAVGRLAAASAKASDVLISLLDSADEKVRLQASTKIIENWPKLREAGELSEKVRELEVLLKGREYGPPSESYEAIGASQVDGEGHAGPGGHGADEALPGLADGSHHQDDRGCLSARI
jgi:hypothetical protein